MAAEDNKKDIENYFALIRAIYSEKSTPTPPCSGCPFYKKCAEETLACKDFLHYSKTGSIPRNTVPKFRNPNFHWYFLSFLNPRMQPET